MKISKKKVFFFALTILVIAFYFFFLAETNQKNEYILQEDSFSYSQERAPPRYDITFNSTNNSLDIYKISFTSRPLLEYETTIYGLLFLPKGKDNLPGVILLPGGGGTKEAEAKLAALIASWGYAVLTIDQRGIGETGGYALSIEQDYQLFSKGKEPYQHLSVYDVLRSADVLRAYSKINPENILLVGESMGGRYAIIATAIDSYIKGVIAISSAGFHVQRGQFAVGNNFLLSIDPDNYIAKISPRKLFMIHGSNDTVVSLASARTTYEKAKEPKNFFVAEGCTHGYCTYMQNELKKDLEIISHYS